jgi:hypothetical protein
MDVKDIDDRFGVVPVIVERILAVAILKRFFL